MKSRVLVIGPVGLDMVCPIDRLPIKGETLVAESCDMTPGGKGLVSAVTFSEMGIEPVLCALLGNDEGGERVRAFAKKRGLDTRFLFTTKESTTATNLMMIDRDGDRHVIACRGASALLTAEQIEDAFTCLPDAVFIQGDLPSSLIVVAADYAHEQGIPVFFDPGAETTLADFNELGEIEIFMPSEHEVEALLCTTLLNQEEIMRACLAIAKKVNANYYIIKLGERGAILYDGTYCKYSAAYEVEQIDNCFVGAIHSAILVAEYIKDQNVRRALEYANAGGALSVTKKGSIASIPAAAQIDAVVKDNLRGNG